MPKKKSTTKKAQRLFPAYTLKNVLIVLLPTMLATVISALVDAATVKNCVPTDHVSCSSGAGNLIGFVGMAVLPIFAFLWLKNRQKLSWADFGFSIPPIRQSAKLIGIGLIIFTATKLILDALAPSVPSLGGQQDLFGSADINFAGLALVLGIGIFGPVVEEVIFRGIFFNILAGRLGLPVAAILSSIIFGLVHAQLNVGISTFVSGLYLCYMAARTRSLMPGIMLHVINNTLAISLILLAQALKP